MSECEGFSDLLVSLKDAILYPDPEDSSYEYWVIDVFAQAWREVEGESYKEYLEEHGDDRRAITNLLGSFDMTANVIFIRVLKRAEELLPLSRDGVL